MSLPVPLPIPLPLSPLDSILFAFNQNPYFIGLMMILLNIGGRFLKLDVTKQQEKILQHPWVRRLLIFTVIFVGTRNVIVSFWMTLVIVLFIGYLFNENSALCLFGSGTKGTTCSTPKESMTYEENDILQRLLAKSQRMNKGTSISKGKGQGEGEGKGKGKGEGEGEEEEEVSLTDIYTANLTLLRK